MSFATFTPRLRYRRSVTKWWPHWYKRNMFLSLKTCINQNIQFKTKCQQIHIKIKTMPKQCQQCQTMPNVPQTMGGWNNAKQCQTMPNLPNLPDNESQTKRKTKIRGNIFKAYCQGRQLETCILHKFRYFNSKTQTQA